VGVVDLPDDNFGSFGWLGSFGWVVSALRLVDDTRDFGSFGLVDLAFGSLVDDVCHVGSLVDDGSFGSLVDDAVRGFDFDDVRDFGSFVWLGLALGCLALGFDCGSFGSVGSLGLRCKL